MRGTITTYPADSTLTYTWSAKDSAGVVITGFKSTSGQTTTWKAPEEAGTYTLTCTIDDAWTATNTGLAKNEKGERDDPSVNRSVTVTVEKYKIYDVSTVGEDGTLTAVSANNPDPCKYLAAVKKPNDYITVKADIEKVPYAPVGADQLLPDTVKWSGGESVPGKGQTYRRFSKADANKFDVEISLGSSKYSLVIYIVWATGEFSTAHYADNKGLEIPSHPKGLAGADPQTGIYHSYCDIQFTIQPNSFITDSMSGPQQKFYRGKISWEVEREKKSKYWQRSGNTWSVYQDTSQTWEPDTYIQSARDLNPWDDGGAGHLYGMDTPGYGSELHFLLNGFVAKLNSREFAKVNLGKGLLKCSDYLPWRAFRGIKRDGVWSQDDAFENEIVEGNLFWGTVPVIPTVPLTQ